MNIQNHIKKDLKIVRKILLDVKLINYSEKKLGNKCSKCGSKEKLEIHHFNYRDFTIGNCLLLCQKCHKKIHL